MNNEGVYAKVIPQRKATTPRVLGVRPLVEADLQYLREKSVGSNRVKNLRDSHHMVARLIATGMRLPEVAAQSGYSLARLHTLNLDPSMKELVAKYRETVNAAYVEAVDEFQRTSISNMTKAERMLADKLDQVDEAGETLPTRELIAITSDRMDRFGYGKKNMNLNVNVDFAAKLEAAIARTKKIAAE